MNLANIKLWSLILTTLLGFIDIYLLYVSWFSQDNNLTNLGFFTASLAVIIFTFVIYIIFKSSALYNRKYKSFQEYFDNLKSNNPSVNELIKNLTDLSSNEKKIKAKKVLEKLLKYEDSNRQVNNERESLSILFDLTCDFLFIMIGLFINNVEFTTFNIRLIQLIYFAFSLVIIIIWHKFQSRILNTLRKLENPSNSNRQ